jgi:hypothetical protein
MNRFVMMPWSVLASKSVTPSEKLLVAVINSLSIEQGYAWPTNDYLAAVMGSDERQVRRWIEGLCEAGILIRKYVRRKDGSQQRILSVRMDSELPGGEGEIHPGGRVENTREGEGEDHPPYYNILSSSNTSNTKYNKQEMEARFNELWVIYGKRGGKHPALKAYFRLSESEQALVHEHVPQYIEHHVAAEKEDFVPHFSTYLNQKRWESALPYESKVQSSNPWSKVKW